MTSVLGSKLSVWVTVAGSEYFEAAFEAEKPKPILVVLEPVTHFSLRQVQKELGEV